MLLALASGYELVAVPYTLTASVAARGVLSAASASGALTACTVAGNGTIAGLQDEAGALILDQAGGNIS